MAFNDMNEDVLFGNFESHEHDVNTEVLFNPIETEHLHDAHDYDLGEEPISNASYYDSYEDTGSSNYVIEPLFFDEPARPDDVGEEPIVREEAPAVEVPKAPTVASDELSALAKPEVQKPKYIEKNFAEKLLHADYDIIKRYDELKNYILKFKGIKSRVSNDFDSFNMGRTQLFKLGYSTKSLKLFLNLDYAKVETRLKCKDAGHKKAYAQVPVFLRIKSPRAMRNAIYLINQVIEKFGIKPDPKAPAHIDSVKILRQKAKTYDNK